MRGSLRNAHLSKVCPIPNTILKDPAHPENEEQLWDKFVLMHHADKI
nr:4Fe-4S ferredoxin [Raoultella sp. NCTC 9187]